MWIHICDLHKQNNYIGILNSLEETNIIFFTRILS